MRILVTGAAGFICGYVVEELLAAGHEVVGLDNHSKYGRVKRSFDDHPRYRFIEGDAKDVALLTDLAGDCDHLLAAASMVGGIAYSHRYAYDLLAENERITAAAFDAAIAAHRRGRLRKITVLSSSMVFERTTVFPTPESALPETMPPLSSYGFQKLAVEYFARAAWMQYELPYTIVRPFNCVGIGERTPLGADRVESGNLKLALSHVVPDLVVKALRGQYPLHVFGDGTQLRHYTYGGDLARGIRICIESEKATNEDFNISTPVGMTVREVAALVWLKIHGDRPLRLVHDPPFEHDVQQRQPDVRKARDVLGFSATTPLDRVLDEVISWIGQDLAVTRS